ncbi:MAG: zf-HC2 domain-containing protein [Actinomycetota bacterium]|nr:zf-HC2 domain-containing protein [Actinomycetota bacterium]
MNAVRSSIVCQRIREQVSLRLDGELSQLELRMVAAHLERCAECRTFEESVREFTEELRAAPLQSPRLPILVRRARRVSLSAVQISVAATLAVAVLGVLSQVGLPGSADPAVGGGLSTANLFKTTWQPEREIAQIDANLPGTDRPGPFSAI